MQATKALPSTPPGTPYPVAPIPKRPPKRVLLVALGVGAIALTVAGVRWWQYASTHQETDDAYVTGHIHPVNSRVSGTVTQVLVDDNQRVAQGQLLVQLDPRDYEVALQQAQAALEAARHQADVAQTNIGVVAANAQGQTTAAQGNIDAAAASISTSEAALAEARAGVPAAQANLVQVEANLVKAKLDYDRYINLVREGASPQQQLDAAKATYEALLAQRNTLKEQIRQAQAQVVQAQKNVDNAQAKLAATKGTLEQANSVTKQTEANRRQYQAALAAIAQAQSQVKNAQLQLSYTRITAPTAGLIGNKTAEVGQRLQSGQTLMAVVQDQEWIVANFKETQLGKMKPGQLVEIKIDSFPNHPFKGKVDSLSPASGAKFALLPPDNATGNFTKIVQRVPVKVVFDPESMKGYESQIAPGMSVTVSVLLN
ncbi:MAG: HlyD family secretion protein [Stenomitos rutilans HA7619-LM2]|nr:HlyD family secretion protein [Stenomitos rutilans HA7619-LM2]